MKGTLPLLVAALAAGLIPHMPHLSPWIPAWCFVFWGYAALSEPRGWPLPRPLSRMCLTFLGFACVFVSSNGVIDNSFGAGLLCVMAGLKTLEVRRERDLFIAIFIAYFMVVSSLFFSASLVMTVYMVAAMIHITAILLRINCPGVPLKEAFKVSGAITGKAIPLTLVLFFFFPRIDGSLFGISSKRSATSGFSNTLSPGSVSRMVKSEAPVFRVTFGDAIPSPDQRYFRGIVFQTFDGITWRSTTRPPSGALVTSAASHVSYDIMVETKNSDRLFPLDLPTRIPKGTRLRADYTLEKPKGGLKEAPYRFQSATAYATGPFNPWEAVFTRLPAGGNPQSRRLARRWRAQATEARQVVDNALAYLGSNGFVYTLNPPPLSGERVDRFLFESRKGFCEHYASAFVYLMRAAGIPARIVGGYLGGTVNPMGHYLIVRQADAHAWTEVWLKGEGWVRVDPTSVVAPDRVERGAGFGLPEADRPSFFIGDGASFLARGLKRIQLGWDAVNYHWDTRVIGYSGTLQDAFLKKLGASSGNWKGWLTAAAWGISFCGAIFALAWLILELRSRNRTSPARASWELFQKKLRKENITRHGATGPLDFLDHIKREHPHLYPEARSIIRLYVALTYGRDAGNNTKLGDLKRAVTRFNPRKIHPRAQETGPRVRRI
ncbi:transglutaminaseTgpA domain-containing protein [Desulfoluna spongiiphila]|uniref:Transglutaminase-like enzyme, putative cysteine protease n=1 Tax=Desulfoluna spongiiphila TaxID=419481 RepID=A0A1G5BTQ8_9BACT|nr:DUF3488 and transglutaminase-like domain-containing protein [Desulfoluna spongiiphila]SCX93456.1 Transglutaminase-like enzyme, putative cysteine protease [Desulfoluna spongiiphila]